MSTLKPIEDTKRSIAAIMSTSLDVLGGVSNMVQGFEDCTGTSPARLDVDSKFVGERTIVHKNKIKVIDNLKEPEEVQLKPLDAAKVTVTETLNAVASAARGLSYLASSFEEWSRDLPERARHAAELSHAAAIEQSKKELLELAKSRGFETVEAMIEDNRKFIAMLHNECKK